MPDGTVLDDSIVDSLQDSESPTLTQTVTPAALQDIVLACVAGLLFANEEAGPQSSEEHYLYAVRQRMPVATDQLLLLLEKTLQQPAVSDQPLIHLAHHYQLHWLEILTMALCLAVERDAMIGRAIAYLQAPLGSSRPTLGLLESALWPLLMQQQDGLEETSSVSTSLLSGKALELGILQNLNQLAPIPEQVVQIPQTIVVALQGGWQNIRGTSIVPDAESVRLPESVCWQAVQHAGALASSERRALIIRSTSQQEAQAVVAMIATQLQRVPLYLTSAEINNEPIGILCVIASLLPVVRLSLNLSDQQPLPELVGYDGPLLAIAEPDGMIRSERYSVMDWLVPIPRPEERYRLWSHYIHNEQLARELANDHRHSAGRIAELADLSRRQSELQQRQQQNREDIRRAAWMNCGDQLSTLAQAIPERIGDNALVLTASTSSELDMLLERCRNRESLVDKLGVSLTSRYQPGVRGLFTGPSGTGKTLAAAWLATRLAMPLYRVDLASVLSKYIGETEKNLASLLARAERSDVILLFDEADALFGKRTDIKDANDRYANTQTNYLLQRIENYQGIVILTSNSRSRFDSAFTRRIDLIIDFPVPGPQERRAIWLSHLGNCHQLSSAQINQLSATVDMAGGHIRNAVLAAAVLAHKEQRVIDYDDVLEGLKIEYKKLARKIPVELKKASGMGVIES